MGKGVTEREGVGESESEGKGKDMGKGKVKKERTKASPRVVGGEIVRLYGI